VASKAVPRPRVRERERGRRSGIGMVGLDMGIVGLKWGGSGGQGAFGVRE